MYLAGPSALTWACSAAMHAGHWANTANTCPKHAGRQTWRMTHAGLTEPPNTSSFDAKLQGKCWLSGTFHLTVVKLGQMLIICIFWNTFSLLSVSQSSNLKDDGADSNVSDVIKSCLEQRSHSVLFFSMRSCSWFRINQSLLLLQFTYSLHSLSCCGAILTTATLNHNCQQQFAYNWGHVQ